MKCNRWSGNRLIHVLILVIWFHLISSVHFRFGSSFMKTGGVWMLAEGNSSETSEKIDGEMELYQWSRSKVFGCEEVWREPVRPSKIVRLTLRKASCVGEYEGSVESLQHPNFQRQILLHRWCEFVGLYRKFQPLGYHKPPTSSAKGCSWNTRNRPQFHHPSLCARRCHCVSRNLQLGKAPSRAAPHSLR